jgi:hypothetical protein
VLVCSESHRAPVSFGLWRAFDVRPSLILDCSLINRSSTAFVHALVSALLLSPGCRGSWLIKTGVLLAVLALLRFGLHCVLLLQWPFRVSYPALRHMLLRGCMCRSILVVWVVLASVLLLSNPWLIGYTVFQPCCPFTPLGQRSLSFSLPFHDHAWCIHLVSDRILISWPKALRGRTASQ